MSIWKDFQAAIDYAWLCLEGGENKVSIRTCEVSGEDCTAPAGYQIGGPGGPIVENEFNSTRATCFACGLPVCTSCSRRRSWFKYGRRRVCEDCEEQFEKTNASLEPDGKCIVAGEEVSPEVYVEFLKFLDLYDYAKSLAELPVNDDTVVEEQAPGVVETELTWGYLMRPLRQKLAHLYSEKGIGNER